MSEETKIKISESVKAKPMTKEQNERRLRNLRKALCGKPRSAEVKAKISQAKLGKPSGMLGKHHSEESKKKIGASNRLSVKRYWQKQKCLTTNQ